LVSLRCSAHRPRASKARTLLHELQAVLRSSIGPFRKAGRTKGPDRFSAIRLSSRPTGGPGWIRTNDLSFHRITETQGLVLIYEKANAVATIGVAVFEG
jgi:hypothetical protein